jgi:predicted phosphodiesterase
MKFQLISDIHLEFYKSFPKIPPIEDTLILAGDIGKINIPNFEPFLQYCNDNWKLVIYVLGNHEYYHNKKTFDILFLEYQELIKKFPNIKLLENDEFETDECLFIETTFFPKIKIPFTNCFQQIKEKNDKNWTVGISISTWNLLFQKSYFYLQNRLKKLPDKKIVIITHYPLTMSGTSSPKYDLNTFEKKENFAFEFDFENKKNLICLAGHTHYSFDFIKDGIRFISNQIGYHDEEIILKEDLVFEI